MSTALQPQPAYQVVGSGEPILLLPPAATRARVWLDHQAPALTAAGYQVVALDHRGTPPAPAPIGLLRISDLLADTVDLIGRLGVAPCRVVGASLGAMVAQELVAQRPDLVSSVALLATRCRTDFFRATLARVHAARARAGGGRSSDLDALTHLLELFSPRTLADDRSAADWFALFRAYPITGLGPAAQYEATIIPDRADALREVDRPCLVVGFADDVLTPPAMCREVASAIPGSRYLTIPDCGHFGFLERPDAVNAALIEFFAAA